MKKVFIILFSAVSLLSSCIKQLDKTFQGQPVAEIDATPLNSTFVGVTYPIITRHPVEGRPISTTLDSTIRRISGTVKIRVNLVGPQSQKDETVGYQIFSTPITSILFPATISGQTPSMSSGTVAVSDAAAGTHYTAVSGVVTIPAKSSFGFITVQILNPGPSAGQARFVGIQLNGSGTIAPSINYSQLGLVIDQR